MNTLLKILAAIYLLMWIFIGAVVIVGGVVALGAARHYAPVVSGLIGGSDGPAMMQKFSDPHERAAFYKNISPEQKACLTAAVGEAEVQRALTEKNYAPSAAVMMKARACLP